MEQAKKIYSAINAVMKEIEAIGKNQQNQQQKYKYRGIDDFYNTIHKLFVKYSIFTTSEIINHESDSIQKGDKIVFSDRIIIKYTFHADDGSSLITEVVGAGYDHSDKGAYKALAGAHKYALQQIFLVPTDDKKDPEIDDIQIEKKTPLQIAKEKTNELKASMHGLFEPSEIAEFQNQLIKNKDDIDALREIYKEYKNIRDGRELAKAEKPTK